MCKKTISWDLAKALKAGSHFKWVAWPEVQKFDSRHLFYPLKHRLPETQIVATDIPAVKSKEEKGGVEIVVQLWGPKVKRFRAARAGNRGMKNTVSCTQHQLLLPARAADCTSTVTRMITKKNRTSHTCTPLPFLTDLLLST